MYARDSHNIGLFTGKLLGMQRVFIVKSMGKARRSTVEGIATDLLKRCDSLQLALGRTQ
jgi:hypothetical protein